MGRALLGWDLGRFGLPFDVACHVGTLIAVTALFARDVRAMVMALPGALMGRPGEHERLIRLIAIGGREAAARLVFLLSLPAVTAAAVKEGFDLANHSLTVFAYYRVALAPLTLLWLLARGGGGA